MDNPLNVQRRDARKNIRAEQRRAITHKRIDKVEKIMNSSSDSRTFAKLINQQIKESQIITVLREL